MKTKIYKVSRERAIEIASQSQLRTDGGSPELLR